MPGTSTHRAAHALRAQQRVGRYEIFDRIAAGGMATVHLARLSGAEGFSRVVAVKRLHPHLLADPDFKVMFIAEARVATRVRHPNVVPILDVLTENEELLIVMDYVHGEALMALLRASHRARAVVPLEIACSIMLAVLQGLHAAHTAHDEKGRALGIVHRDVSPQNVLVGADGVTRVLDFGIAKADHGREVTEPGVLKGKFSYMAPEVVRGSPASPQSDLFSAATVFWELLTGKKLFSGVTEQERLARILAGNYPLPKSVLPSVPESVNRIVARGIAVEPADRYASALEMAIEIEQSGLIASQRVVGEWVNGLAAGVLAERAAFIHDIETSSFGFTARSAPPPPLPSATPLPTVAVGLAPAPSQSVVRPKLASAVAKPVLVLVGLAVALVLVAGFVLFGREKPAPVVVTAAPPKEVSRAAVPTAEVPPPQPSPAPRAAAAPPVATVPPAETPAPLELSAPAPRTTAEGASRPNAAPRSSPAPRARKRTTKGYLPDEL